MRRLERLRIWLERPAGNVELAAEWAHMTALRELTVTGNHGFYDPNRVLLVSTRCARHQHSPMRTGALHS